MNKDALFTVLHEVVRLATGLPGNRIIEADNNRHAPKGEYCAIKISRAARERGRAFQTFTNSDPVSSPIGEVNDVVQNIGQQMLQEVSFNFYRGNAHDYARKMLAADVRFDVSDLLMTNSVGIMGRTGVNDLTALQSGNKEPRAELSLTVASVDVQTVTVNGIYSATVSVENESGQVLETIAVS